MSDLRTRLQSFLAESSTRKLARLAPATLLASSAGLSLAALIGSQAFATSAAGIILGGVAINFTSSLLEKLVMLPLEAEDEREAIIQQGLEQQDPAVAKLVAATLVQTGPELALALPESGRGDIVAGLERAMQQVGGPLAAIAPRYIAALGNAQMNWAQVQQELRATITSVSQQMEASEEGVISGGQQRVEHASDSVIQEMRATSKGRIENSSQTVIGAGSATNQRRCPDCGAVMSAGQHVCGSCGKALGSQGA